MNSKGLGLKQQILLAAFELTGGDLNKTFTAEDLLVPVGELRGLVSRRGNGYGAARADDFVQA